MTTATDLATVESRWVYPRAIGPGGVSIGGGPAPAGAPGAVRVGTVAETSGAVPIHSEPGYSYFLVGTAQDSGVPGARDIGGAVHPASAAYNSSASALSAVGGHSEAGPGATSGGASWLPSGQLLKTTASDKAAGTSAGTASAPTGGTVSSTTSLSVGSDLFNGLSATHLVILGVAVIALLFISRKVL